MAAVTVYLGGDVELDIVICIVVAVVAYLALDTYVWYQRNIKNNEDKSFR